MTLTIKRGEVLALIGPNGAGKSTTFNLVTGVLALTSGEVQFRGQPVAGLASRDIARRGMSRTFQHVKMVPEMTVLENVAIGGYLRSKSGTLKAMLRLDRAEERGLFADIALVKGWKGDTAGNLIYRKAARNFNPMAATAGKITVAEVEELVEIGELDPDQVHLSGAYVQRIFKGKDYQKRIEQRTVRK